MIHSENVLINTKMFPKDLLLHHYFPLLPPQWQLLLQPNYPNSFSY